MIQPPPMTPNTAVRLLADQDSQLDYGHDLTEWLAETGDGDTVDAVTVTTDVDTATVAAPHVVGTTGVSATIQAVEDTLVEFKVTTASGRVAAFFTRLTVTPR